LTPLAQTTLSFTGLTACSRFVVPLSWGVTVGPSLDEAGSGFRKKGAEGSRLPEQAITRRAATPVPAAAMESERSMGVSDGGVGVSSELPRAMRVGKEALLCLQAGEISRDIDPSALADFLLNSFEGAMLRMKVEKDSSPLDHFMTLVFSRVLT
jgi:hypothetical protein